MKFVEQYARCESCDTLLSLDPSTEKEQYEKGRIRVMAQSTILLNTLGSLDSHSKSIDGYYCNIDCLIEHLRDLRGEPHE